MLRLDRPSLYLRVLSFIEGSSYISGHARIRSLIQKYLAISSTSQLKSYSSRIMDSRTTVASLPWWQSETNIAAIRDYALQRGLLVRASEDPKDDRCMQIAVTVLPTLFPEELFHLACDVQRDVNDLVHAVSQDHQFLVAVLGAAIKSDEFTRRLFQVYEQVRQDNRQTCNLGIHRSDYMVDCSPVSMDTDPGTDPSVSNQVCLRQIEVNTIASSFFGLTSRLKDFHEYVHSRYCHSDSLKLPENSCLESSVDAVACAWREYGKGSSCVLMVVHGAERNIFDQRALEFGLWKRHEILVIRKSLVQLSQEASLGPDRELLVSGSEVAVVYYRAGYSPMDYPRDEHWQARLLLERSRATNCPSAAYQLVGTKKMQQALAEPGVLERFVTSEAAVKRMRSTFAGLYTLELTPAGDAAMEMALRDPEKFVLKPQREGGGNNHYGEKVREVLQQVGHTPERTAFILMDRVHPPPQQGFILKAGQFTLEPLPLISELGIFGTYVRKGERVLLNTEGGHILRTKLVTVNEGSVAIGAAALDAPNLIPSRNFIETVSKNR